jgi:hypothetical protein
MTTAFLEKAIPALGEAGVQLVSAPALIMQEQQTALLAKINKQPYETVERPAIAECNFSAAYQCE